MVIDNTQSIIDLSSSRSDIQPLQLFFQDLLIEIYLLKSQAILYCQELKSFISRVNVMRISPLIYSIPRLMTEDVTDPHHAQKVQKFSNEKKIKFDAYILSKPSPMAAETILKTQYFKPINDNDQAFTNNKITNSPKKSENLNRSDHKPNLTPAVKLKTKPTILKEKVIQAEARPEIKLQASTFIPTVTALYILTENATSSAKTLNNVRHSIYHSSKHPPLDPVNEPTELTAPEDPTQSSIGARGSDGGVGTGIGCGLAVPIVHMDIDYDIQPPLPTGRPQPISENITRVERNSGTITEPEMNANRETRQPVLIRSARSERNTLPNLNYKPKPKPKLVTPITHLPLAIGLLNNALLNTTPNPSNLIKEPKLDKGQAFYMSTSNFTKPEFRDELDNSTEMQVNNFETQIDEQDLDELSDSNSKPIDFLSIGKPVDMRAQRSRDKPTLSSFAPKGENVGVEKNSNDASAIAILQHKMVDTSPHLFGPLLPQKSAKISARFKLPFYPPQLGSVNYDAMNFREYTILSGDSIKYNRPKTQIKRSAEIFGIISKETIADIEKDIEPISKNGSDVLKILNSITKSNNAILTNIMINRSNIGFENNVMLPKSALNSTCELFVIKRKTLQLNYKLNKRYELLPVSTPQTSHTITANPTSSALGLMGEAANYAASCDLGYYRQLHAHSIYPSGIGYNLFPTMKTFEIFGRGGARAQIRQRKWSMTPQEGSEVPLGLGITTSITADLENLERPPVEKIKSHLFENPIGPRNLANLKNEILQIKAALEILNYEHSKLDIMPANSKNNQTRIMENNKLTGQFKRLIYDAWLEFIRKELKRYGG